MRIAFFGGSFDPPHCGHLAVAHAAREALALDRVLFAPVGLQPFKPDGSSASFEDRVAMTRLAIEGEQGFELSLADAPAGDTPNYTVDTLTRLHTALPENTKLFLLLGADAFRSLPSWRQTAEIRQLAQLIVASRPGESLPEAGQPGLYLLSDVHYEISATEIREQIHGNSANLPPLLPPAVLTYIHQHGLYR